MAAGDENDPGDAGRRPGEADEGPAGELPPPPPMSAFVERGAVRLMAEAAVGAGVGWLLAGSLGLADVGRGTVALAGAGLAPLALLLTPLHGSIMVRALRYGGALAVLGMLLVSFTGPGRERPVEELLGIGVLLLGVGAVGHGILLMGGGDRAD